METMIYCNIEASVVTGFEHIAAKESEEKLGISGSIDRGRIFLNIPYQRVKEVLKLRCVDNLFVVIKRINDYRIPHDKADALTHINALCDDIDWKSGLEVWKEFFDYPHSVDEIMTVKRIMRSNTEGQENDTIGENDDKVGEGKNMADEGVTGEITVLTNEGEELPSGGNNETGESNAIAGDDSIGQNLVSNVRFPPKFRVTCNRTGTSHSFSSMEAAAEFGGKVQEKFNWTVKMKEYDIEVVLNINEQQVYVCLSLTNESLHRRNITHFGPTTLRSTIAHGMLRLCDIGVGDIVCDPMCGGGTIPIECSINWPGITHHMCGDIHEKAWTRTHQNVTVLNNRMMKSDGNQSSPSSSVHVDIMRWDASRLPLRSHAVDVFVTDLPFGKRCGSRNDNRVLYRSCMMEFARCSPPNTGRAVLLTQDKRTLLYTLKSDTVSRFWRKCHVQWVNVGGLDAAVYVLRRTSVCV